jgi:cytochrome b
MTPLKALLLLAVWIAAASSTLAGLAGAKETTRVMNARRQQANDNHRNLVRCLLFILLFLLHV